MRNLFLLIPLAITLCLAVAGCQTVSSVGGAVSNEDAIRIPSGESSGQWAGKDLAVNYKCLRTQDGMNLSGVIRFSSHMTTNFDTLKSFNLAAMFLDEKGKVLQDSGVTSYTGGIVEPIHFDVHLKVPSGVAGMAFSYKGTALSTGDKSGGGGTNFWQYPVHK